MVHGREAYTQGGIYQGVPQGGERYIPGCTSGWRGSIYTRVYLRVWIVLPSRVYLRVWIVLTTRVYLRVYTSHNPGIPQGIYLFPQPGYTSVSLLGISPRPCSHTPFHCWPRVVLPSSTRFTVGQEFSSRSPVSLLVSSPTSLRLGPS